MTRFRENELDKRHQKRLFEVFAERNNVDFTQFPSNSGKYVIDGYTHAEGNLHSWIEAKWYSKTAHLYLNVPKFVQLCTLSRCTKRPSNLLFREGDRWGYIIVHDGVQVTDYETVISGGTPKGRPHNIDDVEPLIQFKRKDIIWGI